MTPDEIQPGMRLMEPVVQAGRVMLQADRELHASEIDALRRRFPKAQVQVCDPLLDALVAFENNAREREATNYVQTRVMERMAGIYQKLQTAGALDRGDVAALGDLATELVTFLRDQRLRAALIDSCPDRETYLAVHAGNVLCLAACLAHHTLNYLIREQRRLSISRTLNVRQASNLAPLGLGILLMDIGLLPLRKLLEPTRKSLSDTEVEQLRRHPAAALQCFPPNISALARMVIRTHHENQTGDGYPGEVPPEQQHIYTRLVRLADAYDAATATAVFAHARAPVRVLWEMTRTPVRSHYDAVLLDALAQLVQPLPIGAKLRLADGRFGVVVKSNPGQPFAPSVLVAFDTQGRALPRYQLTEPVALGATPETRAATYRDQDLSFLYTGARLKRRAPEEPFATPLDAFYP